MFSSLISWLSGFLSNAFNSYWTLFANATDAVHRFLNGMVWFFAAVCIVVAMFWNVAHWMETFLTFVYATYSGVTPASVVGQYHDFAAMYGFVDWIFPLHETISAFLLLMPLYLAVNTIRLIRAVLSLMQFNGWGIQN